MLSSSRSQPFRVRSPSTRTLGGIVATGSGYLEMSEMVMVFLNKQKTQKQHPQPAKHARRCQKSSRSSDRVSRAYLPLTFAGNSVPRTAEAATCRDYAEEDFFVAALSIMTIPGFTTVTYAQHGGVDVELDFKVPSGASTERPAPILLWFHGGGGHCD